LMFQTLPIAFGAMPWGGFIGLLFFILVAFAAWTSSISLVEPAVAWITENTTYNRRQAAWVIGLTAWLLGIAVLLSFNHWQQITLLFGLNIFDTLDKLTTNILLPVGGLLMALFAGWVMKTEHVQAELGLVRQTYQLWRFTLRFISPLAILAIFLYLFGLLT